MHIIVRSVHTSRKERAYHRKEHANSRKERA
ncbi:hypothetical protein EZS27_029863 [termite gut metagenome]|uniref:Uncharacterized protein n=1 Tax=termite gut metagenome TaxID=433724 RepID=A0A5J4QIF3_9ZZZZ